MKDEVQKTLDEVIDEGIKSLPGMPVGSTERTEMAHELTELYKLRIEEAKIGQAATEKQKQLSAQSLDRWVNVGAQVGVALLSLIAYNAWYNRGLRFEETGTITSHMTRNLIGRLLPKK